MAKFVTVVNKVISYIPVIRGIVDILVGAYRGIVGALQNPQYDKEKFLEDATMSLDDYAKPYQSKGND